MSIIYKNQDKVIVDTGVKRFRGTIIARFDQHPQYWAVLDNSKLSKIEDASILDHKNCTSIIHESAIKKI